MKKTLKLTSVLLALLLLIVSCSPEKQMDGKTAETKKQMTETEYSQNFKVNNDGFKVVSSLNVTIFIGDKTIEIEKDADEKWIEIDGTFFDDS